MKQIIYNIFLDMLKEKYLLPQQHTEYEKIEGHNIRYKTFVGNRDEDQLQATIFISNGQRYIYSINFVPGNVGISCHDFDRIPSIEDVLDIMKIISNHIALKKKSQIHKDYMIKLLLNKKEKLDKQIREIQDYINNL